MKIYIVPSFCHKMNLISLKLCIEILKWDIVNTLEEADIVYSPSILIDIYPSKKYIFGPHFSVFPNDVVKKITYEYKNTIYIQPCEWVKELWVNEFSYNNINVIVYPFCIDTDKYNSLNIQKNKIFVYTKSRSSHDINYVLNYIKNNNNHYELINYGNYNEEDYLNLLKQSKYGIWIGQHESQGFALLCALSCNVPLLVWSTTKMSQELNVDPIHQYENIKTKAITNPYWDKRCGEYFYENNQFIDTYHKFINNLENYKPREYIIENLTPEICAEKLKNIINNI